MFKIWTLKKQKNKKTLLGSSTWFLSTPIQVTLIDEHLIFVTELCCHGDRDVMAVLLCISYWRTYSQPPASPSTQEAIQGMLSMANLSSSESLQQPWSNSQARNNSQSRSNSHSTQASRKSGGTTTGSNNSKRPPKRLPKKPRKSSSIESLDYDDQYHMDACFKDSDYGMWKRSIVYCWHSFSVLH